MKDHVQLAGRGLETTVVPSFFVEWTIWKTEGQYWMSLSSSLCRAVALTVGFVDVGLSLCKQEGMLT